MWTDRGVELLLNLKLQYEVSKTPVSCLHTNSKMEFSENLHRFPKTPVLVTNRSNCNEKPPKREKKVFQFCDFSLNVFSIPGFTL